MHSFPIWPQTASAYAGRINFLFITLLVTTALTVGLVFFLLLLFATKYRHGSKAVRHEPTQKTWRFEVAWTAATLLIFVGVAVWGASLFLRLYNPPANALQIFIVGKQWMWKAQHPGGQREINALHVPVDRDVRLVMASQDVIHSFYIPALRIKQDVVPGRYETMWFRANKVGR
ncbi:MAG TPA: cytochrome c oxidase subunit II transmembrane domain-containing protein, partial [Sphingomicrobium sp.]|nr:cytochrome c oxidase subunit II transmembrane domain-containing protein [Sphingomicrobium sp.]